MPRKEQKRPTAQEFPDRPDSGEKYRQLVQDLYSRSSSTESTTEEPEKES